MRCQAKTLEQSSEDFGFWLRHSFQTGDDGAVKPTEKRKSFETKRIRLLLHVGEGITGEAGFPHCPEHLHRAGVDATDHFLAAS